MPNKARDQLISFAAAARMTSQPKAYLKELADAGRLSVHLSGSGGDRHYRLSKASLESAGLLAAVDPEPVGGELLALIELVREQSMRISQLEDQKFQLGAQLGAAIERVEAIERSLAPGPERDGSERSFPLYRSAPARVAVSMVNRTGARLGQRLKAIGEPGKIRMTRFRLSHAED